MHGGGIEDRGNFWAMRDTTGKDETSSPSCFWTLQNGSAGSGGGNKMVKMTTSGHTHIFGAHLHVGKSNPLLLGIVYPEKAKMIRLKSVNQTDGFGSNMAGDRETCIHEGRSAARDEEASIIK